MKAISQGDNTYDIFDDSLRVYDQLPAQSYVVRFSERRGFYLSKYVDMEISESKVYGVHEEKVDKVIRAFEEMKRSLGVILSGDKGIGKSLFAKMLATRAMNEGLPIIVVDTYFQGIASYIESIEQEALVLFDEFDKTFAEIDREQGKASPQSTLLTLFDGLSGGKKLFVVTCNNFRRLSDYLINRPGRFHYHFRFEYPSSADVREYLEDKLDRKYYGEINKVESFANRVNLNYDCLRAIAFELNHGLSFSDAIKDLNILNIRTERYRVELKYTNGLTAETKHTSIDMFSDSPIRVPLYDKDDNNFVDVIFLPEDAVFDGFAKKYIVPVEKFHTQYFEEYDTSRSIDIAKSSTIESLIVSLDRQDEWAYRV